MEGTFFFKSPHTIVIATMGQETSPIPVIDISEPSEQTARELLDAATDYGFVFIKSKDVGFNADVIDHMFALVCQCPSNTHSCSSEIPSNGGANPIQSRKFFHSPEEEKEPCRIGVDVLLRELKPRNYAANLAPECRMECHALGDSRSRAPGSQSSIIDLL